MNIEHDTRLTSAEISYLWSVYISDTMSICVFKYFLLHIEDQNIKVLAEHALDLSQQHIKTVEGIFNDEGIPIPKGFTEEDVNLKAERLFSDIFCVYYMKNMVALGISNASITLPYIFRDDILSFNTKNLHSTIELNNEITQVFLEKGLAIRPPYVPYPPDVEFVHKQSFILEMLGKRPLTALETTCLFTNSLTNNIGACISAAFAQVAKSKEVKQYFLRGQEISTKHVKIFIDYLEKQSLPITIPLAINQDVTTSTESPFSDKLLMYHHLLMNRSGVSNYGVTISSCVRSDLVIDFTRLTAEILKFAEDGLNILIDNDWFERPPLASYRKKE